MDVNDVRTISDAIECLEKHKEKWSISIAVDCGDIDTAVEYVFDLVLEAAKKAEKKQCVLSNVCRLYRRADDEHKTRIDEFKNELSELNTRCDIELAHMRADEILCEILQLYGLFDVVDEWRKVAKWYA